MSQLTAAPTSAVASSDPHQEIIAEAREVFSKREATLLRKVVRATPFGLEMAIVAILIPFLTAKLTGWNLLWPGVAVVFGAMLVRLIRDDFKLRAREWWATRTIGVYNDFRKVAADHQALEENYREGEAKLARLADALRTLESVLRSDVIDRCRANISPAKDHVDVTASIRAESLRADLKALCQYVCQVLGSSDNESLRCGILIEDPSDRALMIPLVVYDPSDSSYVSKSRFSKEQDFSGQLLRHFETSRQFRDWKKHTTHVISDVDGIGQSDESLSPRPVTRRPGQERYLKSLAGNVIYCRDHDNEVNVLGVLNIDSKVAGAIQESSYRALQPYLFPAFRLFASRLLLLKAHPQLVNLIWRGKDSE